MRLALAMFLALIIVHLIPSCGIAMATEAAQMACCRIKCPMQSPVEQSGCCQRAVSPSTLIVPAPAQQSIGLSATSAVAFASYIRPIVRATLIVDRSPSPPPCSSRTALCSLQI